MWQTSETVFGWIWKWTLCWTTSMGNAFKCMKISLLWILLWQIRITIYPFTFLHGCFWQSDLCNHNQAKIQKLLSNLTDLSYNGKRVLSLFMLDFKQFYLILLDAGLFVYTEYRTSCFLNSIVRTHSVSNLLLKSKILS